MVCGNTALEYWELPQTLSPCTSAGNLRQMGRKHVCVCERERERERGRERVCMREREKKKVERNRRQRKKVKGIIRKRKVMLARQGD